MFDFLQDKATALIVASLCGHSEIVQFLLAADADVNAQFKARYKFML